MGIMVYSLLWVMQDLYEVPVCVQLPMLVVVPSDGVYG